MGSGGRVGGCLGGLNTQGGSACNLGLGVRVLGLGCRVYSPETLSQLRLLSVP